jgi:hypothetical protein
MKVHQHGRRTDFGVTRNQNLTVSAVFDPIPIIRCLNVQNGAHGQFVETHAAIHLRLADGSIDRVVKVRMRPEGLRR